MAGGEQLKGPARAQLLLVDDDGQNLQVLYDTLADRDYRLLVARSGADALNIAGRVRPDLVLLDILMP
ncbi:MAG: response regulator, partial [Gammaproteobacteria bacterium]|nr:response regulator [Gammaproteobacteria bacterium]